MKKYFIILLVLLLVSCQNETIQTDQKPHDKASRRNEAAELNTQLGISYLRQGNRERAKRKLLYALELAPRLASANAAMGYFQERSGDNTEAERYYRKALRYSSKSGAQLNNFGTFLCRQGKYKEAEQYFLSAVKDVNYIHSAGAYENAALCAEAIPDYAKAEKYFKMALTQDPDRKRSLIALIDMAKKKNNSKQILGYIEKNFTLVYNDPILLKTAVEVAKKENKTELADFYEKRLLTYNKSGAKNDHNKA